MCNGFSLINFLLGAVKLNKNPDPEKYSYSGYGISFDVRGIFSLPSGGLGKNVIIFGIDKRYLCMLIIIKKHICW